MNDNDKKMLYKFLKYREKCIQLGGHVFNSGSHMIFYNKYLSRMLASAIDEKKMLDTYTIGETINGTIVERCVGGDGFYVNSNRIQRMPIQKSIDIAIDIVTKNTAIQKSILDTINDLIKTTILKDAYKKSYNNIEDVVNYINSTKISEPNSLEISKEAINILIRNVFNKIHGFETHSDIAGILKNILTHYKNTYVDSVIIINDNKVIYNEQLDKTYIISIMKESVLNKINIDGFVKSIDKNFIIPNKNFIIPNKNFGIQQLKYFIILFIWYGFVQYPKK